MAVFITENFDTGPNGAAVVAGTGEAIASKGTTQTLTYSSSSPITGSFSARASVTDAASYIYLVTRYTAVATAWHTFIYITGTALNPAQVYLGAVYSGTTKISDVRENTDGTLTIRDCGPTTGGVARYTTPTATPLPRGTRVRVSYASTPGSTTGLQLRVYVEGSGGFPTTPTYDSGTLSSTSTLTTSSEAHTGITVAMSATVAYAFAVQFDSVICSDTEPAAPTVNSLAPPPPTNTTPPTVTMSADQTIFPSGTATGPTVTVTATATAAGTATISSYNWRVLAAGAISIVPNGSSATFVAPVLTRDAGYQIGVVAVDSNGLASTEAVTNITVVATTEWHNNNGVLVPMRIVNADVPSGTTPAPTPVAQTAALFGVNSSGADFGDPRSTTYLGQYDSDASFAFYATRGHQIVRIPFLWERIQPTLLGALDATELGRLTAAVSSATSRGLTAVIDVHNYCRYKTSDGVTRVLGDGYLNNGHLTDLWTRLAGAFKGNPKVQFGLMNEPHDLPGTSGAYTVTTNRYLWAGSVQGWADEQAVTAASLSTSIVSRQNNGTGSLIVSKAPSTATGYWNVRVTSPAPLGNLSAGGLTLSVWVYCPTGQNGWQGYVIAQSGGASTPAYSDLKASAASPLPAGQWTQLTYTLTSAQAGDINRLLVQIESNAPGTTSPVSFNLSEFTTGSAAGALTGPKQWEAAAQACVTAIRGAGASNWCWVPGYNYAAARSYWTTHPTWWINDPSGMSGPEGHHYFDGDRSGTYTQPYATVNSAAVSAGYANLAAQNTAELKAFTDGVTSRNLAGFIGEYGWTNQGGADQTSWNSAGQAGYTQIKSVPNVSVTAWAAGEAWGTTYLLSVYTGTPQSVLTPIAATVESNGAVPPVAAPNGPTGNWRLTFNDEFAGSSLDLTKWSPLEGKVMNNVTCHASNITVTGGNLILTCASATSGAIISSAQLDGAGNNAYQFPVGSVCEARIYFPGDANGHPYNWPAWWTSGPSWPAAGEHDIAEVLDGSMTVNYHSSAGAFNQGVIPGNWVNGWHTFTLRRNATSADVWYDGVLVKSYATSDNGAAEALILNVGSNSSAYQVYGTGSQVKVDYVRAWAPA